MLRSRFQSLPAAFNAKLIPDEREKVAKQKGLKAFLFRKMDEVIFINLMCFWLYTDKHEQMSSKSKVQFDLTRLQMMSFLFIADFIEQRERSGAVCSIVEQHSQQFQGGGSHK